MRVRKLILRNFRNIQETVFEASEGLNFLIGQNGQGKTSILEALGFLGTLRSFRGAKPLEMLRWGADGGEIRGELFFVDSREEEWKNQFHVSFFHKLIHSVDKKVGKKIFVNEKPVRSSYQYLAQKFDPLSKGQGLGFHTIVFHPADHDLVRGDPGCRRTYLNAVLSAETAEYLGALKTFQKVLVQRNAILKNADGSFGEAGFQEFTEQLIQASAIITRKRLEWLETLLEKISQIMVQIAPLQREISIAYQSSWLPKRDDEKGPSGADLSNKNKILKALHFAGQGALPSLEELEYALREKLTSLSRAERELRTTLAGPHRDDWSFFLGEEPLRGFGSQGEVRSVLVALKLSEIEIFQDRTGIQPVFLLDDFSSELDQKRREFLLNYLMEMKLQTFVTTTDDWEFSAARFYLNDGNLSTYPQNSSTTKQEQGLLL